MRGRSDVLSRRPEVLWRRCDSALVLKRPECSEIVSLDRAGLALWEQLARPATLQELAGRLAAQYDAAPEVVLADLLPVIEDLERRLLVLRRHA